MGLPTYQWSPDQVRFHERMLEKPFSWRQTRMIFTNSMSDFFHEDLPFEVLDRVLEVIEATPQHVYQVLTKRSSRMVEYSRRVGGFPENMWLGVTVESDSNTFRIDHLREIKASTRFVSIEPLIGRVGHLDLSSIDWVIVGGESGPDHRPLNYDWAREVRDQCLNEGVAFFFKQVGGLKPKSGGRLLDGREWNQYPQSARATVPRQTVLAQ